METQLKRLHAIVGGHVQGVGFRYFVLSQAQSLNLTGWVRNLTNGDVEVTAEGNPTDLEQLLSKLHQGPPGSHVISVQAEWLAAENTFTLFSVRSSH